MLTSAAQIIGIGIVGVLAHQPRGSQLFVVTSLGATGTNAN